MQREPRQNFALKFPNAWTWLMDEAVPAHVKLRYSPQESWKDKPFSEKDGGFFFRGINELSELFTDERPRELPNYFQHPKFRSAYLLYFLPLQASKFVSLFQMHPEALQAMLTHARKRGELRILDLGAGPGTASIALLLSLLDLGADAIKDLPIRFEWFDTNRTIMEDGKELALKIASYFPRLRGKLEVELRVAPWWKAAAPQYASLRGEPSLTLMGHVLNEKGGTPPPTPMASAPAPKQAEGDADDDAADDFYIEEDEESNRDDDDFYEEDEAGDSRAPARGKSSTAAAKPPQRRILPELGPIAELYRQAGGAGILLVEPAARGSSQLVSRIRDQLFDTKVVARDPKSIWGPCLHAERCPLAEGRDWCHFSMAAEIPGRWFKKFSHGLGSERQWIKFSYVWLAKPPTLSKARPPEWRRVISDPINVSPLGKGTSTILVCEPEKPGRWTIPTRKPIYRGDILESQPMVEQVSGTRYVTKAMPDTGIPGKKLKPGLTPKSQLPKPRNLRPKKK